MKKRNCFTFVFITVVVILILPLEARCQITVFNDEATFLAAISNPIIVNFDTFPDGTSVPLGFEDDGTPTGFNLTGFEYAGLGVTFSSPVGAVLSTTSTIVGIINYASSPNALTPGSPPYVGPNGTLDDTDDDLMINFSPPVSGAGLHFIDSGSSPTESVTFIDESGNVIGDFPFPGIGPASELPVFFGITSSTPIAEIVIIEDADDGDDVSYDNIIFASTPDSDGDGIPDDADNCPESDLNDTVILNGCDSGVENILFDDGCTISDFIEECVEDAYNHGEFVSCVSHLTNDLKKDGIISEEEKGKIQRCAAQADIP